MQPAIHVIIDTFSTSDCSSPDANPVAVLRIDETTLRQLQQARAKFARVQPITGWYAPIANPGVESELVAGVALDETDPAAPAWRDAFEKLIAGEAEHTLLIGFTEVAFDDEVDIALDVSSTFFFSESGFWWRWRYEHRTGGLETRRVTLEEIENRWVEQYGSLPDDPDSQPVIILNFSGVEIDAVRRQIAAAEAEQAALAAELAKAESVVSAIKRKMHNLALKVFHARRTLAGRARGDLPTGDISSDLDAVAVAIAGGEVRRINGCAVEIADNTGRTWRITFSAEADVFVLDPEYTSIPPEQAIGATVLGTCWDDSWLIEAQQPAARDDCDSDDSDRCCSFHIRLFGDPVRVEELR